MRALLFFIVLLTIMIIGVFDSKLFKIIACSGLIILISIELFNRVTKLNSKSQILIKENITITKDLLSQEAIITFKSPIDSNCYTIQSKFTFVLDEGCYILFNEREPNKSIPIKKLGFSEIIAYLFLIVMSIITIYQSIH